jgi:hypothetical protein
MVGEATSMNIGVGRRSIDDAQLRYLTYCSPPLDLIIGTFKIGDVVLTGCTDPDLALTSSKLNLLAVIGSNSSATSLWY